VSRLAMAAFMNRLGTALTPALLKKELQSGGIPAGAEVVVCQTDDFAVAKFPRHADVDAVFMGIAGTQSEFGADLVASLDGGTSWIEMGATPKLATAAANRWENVRALGSMDLWVGETVRFGIRITAGAALTDSRCIVRATLGNRAVINPPF
jgi:hypothetical protein